MPVDPKKLEAFANQPPKGGKPGGGGKPEGGNKPPGKNGGDEGGGEGGGDEDMQEFGDGKYGALIPLLEENAEDLEANCDELDIDMLKDPSAELADEDKQILVESFDALPDDLKAEMSAALSAISIEDARKLADHLAGEDMVDDAERMGGYLFRIGALVESGELSVDGSEESEGDEEEGEEAAGDEEE